MKMKDVENPRLYIDDLRDPKTSGWVIIRSYPEAIHWMRENGCPEYISFDHDLGSTSDLSGYDIAKWMVKVDLDHHGKWIPKSFDFNVHSANPVGAANITGWLESYLRSKDNA